MSEVNAAAPAGDVYDWYTRGMRLLAAGDAAAAAALLEHAARAEPASCSVREALARALVRLRALRRRPRGLRGERRREPCRRLRALRPGPVARADGRARRSGRAPGHRGRAAAGQPPLRHRLAQRPGRARPRVSEAAHAAGRARRPARRPRRRRAARPRAGARRGRRAGCRSGGRCCRSPSSPTTPPARPRAGGRGAPSSSASHAADRRGTDLVDRLRPRCSPTACPAGSRVLVVGGDGLREPLRAHGLVPVASAEDDPVAVVQGWSPDLTWALLAEGAVAIRRGCPGWRPTATPRCRRRAGRCPATARWSPPSRWRPASSRRSSASPDVRCSTRRCERTGAQRALVIGDRLDTDIAGANAAGLPSLLVLTGVSGPDDLLAAPPEQRPTYVGHDLSALRGPARADHGWGRGEMTASTTCVHARRASSGLGPRQPRRD